jgi:hypothetical protein
VFTKILIIILTTLLSPEPEAVQGAAEAIVQAFEANPQEEEAPERSPQEVFQGGIDRIAYFVEGFVYVAHLNLVATIPIEYGWYLFNAALKTGLDPLDLAAVLISEHSGPDKDFSLVGGISRDYYEDYEVDAEGKAGEVGMFQTMPWWAKKAGFTQEDLKDPEKSIQIGAFVVKNNQESHSQKCEKQRYVWHTWIAHYKCARKDRDLLEGFCRYKQNKWWQLRISLGSITTPDFKAIKKAQKKALKDIQKKAYRDWNRIQKREAKKREKDAREEQEAAATGE